MSDFPNNFRPQNDFVDDGGAAAAGDVPPPRGVPTTDDEFEEKLVLKTVPNMDEVLGCCGCDGGRAEGSVCVGSRILPSLEDRALPPQPPRLLSSRCLAGVTEADDGGEWAPTSIKLSLRRFEDDDDFDAGWTGGTISRH